jgi:hypothetical protein
MVGTEKCSRYNFANYLPFRSAYHERAESVPIFEHARLLLQVFFLHPRQVHSNPFSLTIILIIIFFSKAKSIPYALIIDKPVGCTYKTVLENVFSSAPQTLAWIAIGIFFGLINFFCLKTQIF